MKNLIIIPTYNEKENIVRLIKEILDLNLGLHILVADDNSPDGTAIAVKSLIKNFGDKVFILDRQKKEGLGRAYIAGFKWALERDYQKIISMDADFSHQPKYIPDLLRLGQKYDLVIGSRYVKGGKIIGWNWYRYLNSCGANFLCRILLRLAPKDVTAGFKCYSRKFLSSLNFNELVSSGYAFQVEMILAAKLGNFSITETPIIFIDRKAGESKISGELKKSAWTVLKLAWRTRGGKKMPFDKN